MSLPNRVKTGYYLEILFPETMKLLGRTKSKITKDETGENVSYLEIAEVESIHCNVVNNSYQQNSHLFIHLFLINCLINY